MSNWFLNKTTKSHLSPSDISNNNIVALPLWPWTSRRRIVIKFICHLWPPKHRKSLAHLRSGLKCNGPLIIDSSHPIAQVWITCGRVFIRESTGRIFAQTIPWLTHNKNIRSNTGASTSAEDDAKWKWMMTISARNVVWNSRHRKSTQSTTLCVVPSPSHHLTVSPRNAR